MAVDADAVLVHSRTVGPGAAQVKADRAAVQTAGACPPIPTGGIGPDAAAVVQAAERLAWIEPVDVTTQHDLAVRRQRVLLGRELKQTVAPGDDHVQRLMPRRSLHQQVSAERDAAEGRALDADVCACTLFPQFDAQLPVFEYDVGVDRRRQVDPAAQGHSDRLLDKSFRFVLEKVDRREAQVVEIGQCDGEEEARAGDAPVIPALLAGPAAAQVAEVQGPP